MRLILLLLALLIIGLMVNKQLSPSPSPDEPVKIINNQNQTVPQVPTSATELDQFGNDMDQFMQDTAKKRDDELEKILSK